MVLLQNKKYVEMLQKLRKMNDILMHHFGVKCFSFIYSLTTRRYILDLGTI